MKRHRTGSEINARRGTNGHQSAFSLMEMLVVMAIGAILLSFSGPMLSSLQRGGEVTNAAASLTGLLELSRAHAMSNNTYVRLAFGETTNGNGGMPSTVVLAYSSPDGSAAGATDTWRLMRPPLILRGLVIPPNLASGNNDAVFPSQTDIDEFVHEVPAIGSVNFNSCLQIGPLGGVTVQSKVPARFVEIGIDRPAPQDNKNQFVLRLSGINGAITTLRKEDLSQSL